MIAESGAVIRLPGAGPAALGYGPWVEEVWANYLGNAIKYGRISPAELHIELGFDELPHRFIRFWARDWGPACRKKNRPTSSRPSASTPKSGPLVMAWDCPSCA